MQATVGILMGSDSDLPMMKKAADQLDAFGIAYEMRILSAHRMPDALLAYAKDAKARGIRVIIAGAGMAAALPGMVAAIFPLPVIGVPLASGALNGQDALYSIVQMPPGIPVATVAIGGAKNAAVLAAKMLAIGDEAMQDKLEAFTAQMMHEVEAKDQKLQDGGYNE